MDEKKKNDITDDSAKESRTASENNSDDSESETLNRNKSIENVMEYMDEAEREKRFKRFSLSFIPYLYILWTGIFGIDFWGDKYGFPAMIIVAGLLSLVPVYPALLIFQIMFYIFSVRSGKFGEEQKRGTGRIVLVLICAALVIGIGASILQYDANSYQRNYKDDAEQQKDKEIIEQYLAEEYGEYAEDMKIVAYDYDTYIIKTSLLEKGSFFVSVEDGVVCDGLYDDGRYGFKYEFKEKNSLQDVLDDYLFDTYLNIDNCDVDSYLYDYDFRKFLDGDIKGFAESCEFDVLFVNVYEDKYDREKLVEVAKELCDDFCSDLPRCLDHSIPKVRFIIDGKSAFDTIIINTDYEIIMHVTEYRKGSTFEYEEVHYFYATDEITVTPRNSD